MADLYFEQNVAFVFPRMRMAKVFLCLLEWL